MEPGRELDKLVAEAMGWTNIHQGPTGKWITRRQDSQFLQELPYFSTDWAAAGIAWEWLDKNAIGARLGRVRSASDDNAPGEFYPAVFYLDSGIEKLIATGETYPHAIALAVVNANPDRD